MNHIKTAIILIALCATSGCTSISTRQVDPKDAKVHGIRVYPPRPYLFVSQTESKLVSLPDLKKAYDVKPKAFLAKHDFKLELSDGVIAKAESDQDSTAALTLIQKVAELAADAAKTLSKAAEGAAFATNFGLAPGIYRIDDDGKFELVNPGK